jgi:hypothetical protein
MHRTVPLFRIALAMEEREWKPFRNALDKSGRKKFDEMLFDTSILCSLSLLLYAAQPVRLYPVLMSILLLYGYEEPVECISEVEQMMVTIQGLSKEE